MRRLAYRGFVWNLRGPKEMHMPHDEFIINVYCEICEAYAAVASTPLRQRGFAPALSDEEALEAGDRWRLPGNESGQADLELLSLPLAGLVPGTGRALDLCAPIGQPVGDQAVHAPLLGRAPWRQQALRSSGRWLSRAGVPLPAGAFQPGVSGRGDVWPLRLESADLLRLQGHAADQR